MYTISYPSETIRLHGVVVERLASDPAYQAYAAWLEQGNGPESLQDAAMPRRVIQVNAWQLRRALNQVGLRDSVEAAISGANQDMKDGYLHSPTFSSDEPMTLGMGAALGQDEDAMYALFELAESL